MGQELGLASVLGLVSVRGQELGLGSEQAQEPVQVQVQV